jgi:glutamine amidotransferase
MIVIIDYGVGNLFSLCSSFAFIGKEAVVSSDPQVIASAERIILPGVGAFEDAIKKLKDSGLDKVLLEQAEKGKPIMGICLGMQMLFEESHEYGVHKGLGLIPGRVVPMQGIIDDTLKIPHIGWNELHLSEEKHPIFRYIENGDHVYFVHSYFGSDCEQNVIATTSYDKELTAAVAKGNVCGCQFHPEKSGEVGLNILRGFCDWEG